MARSLKFTPASLYPKQRAAIYDPARIVCIEASTKAGKTVGCLSWFIEEALKGDRGQNFWWVAPIFSQSEIAFRRCWGYLGPVQHLSKRNMSSMFVTLPNGARMMFKSGDRPDDLYGEDVYAAVLDEASRMREESWHAVRSTLTFTRGPVRIIGNVRGRKNWFFRLARLAEEGAGDMAFHRITAWDAVEAGVLDRDEIEQARRDFDRLGQEDVFRQLYMAEALDDASNPFGLQAIANCVVDGFSTSRPVAAGVDLAGRGAVNVERVGDAESRDWTAMVMLDSDGYATRVERWRAPHTETTERVAAAIKRTRALVDSTGTGDAIVENLQRRGDLRVLGFTFTERSRQDLLEGLAIAIQNEDIHFPDLKTADGRGSLRDELESFEFVYSIKGVRYEVPEGMSDDLTMAAALAVKQMPWKRKSTLKPTTVPTPEPYRWTMGADGQGFEAWRKYQEGKKPTTSPEEEAPKSVPVPFIMMPGTGNRWSQAG